MWTPKRIVRHILIGANRMKRIVWIFGLVSGGILSAMMLLTLPFETLGDRGEIIGYTTMVLSFLLVYFGVRSYRDNVAGGAVGFGRALAVGTLIVVISSLCYVATWEVIYFKIRPDFGEKYAAYSIQKARQGGASEAEIQRRTEEMHQFVERYRNPVFNSAVTFLEPLPVGLVIALVSAGVLRRKRERSGSLATTVA
jgi:hypothetical protein